MARHDSNETTQDKQTRRGVSKRSASRLRPASSARRQSESKTSSTGKKRNARHLMAAAVIVLFAVLMALSLMLPSLAQIFSSNHDAQQAEAEAQRAATQGSSGSGSAATSSDLTTVDGIFSAYSEEIATLETKLADDPENLAHLLHCGQAYMECARSASQYAQSDADAEKITAYFKKATQYFDAYLKLNDSEAVRVDHALCELYQGHTETAISELKDLSQASPEYGPAWANLGLAYETAGDVASARQAYVKAQEADPDDEYGSYSYAAARIAQIDQAAASAAERATTDEDAETDSSGAASLQNDLAGTSGN